LKWRPVTVSLNTGAVSLDDEGIELPDTAAAHDVALGRPFFAPTATLSWKVLAIGILRRGRVETGPVLEIAADFLPGFSERNEWEAVAPPPANMGITQPGASPRRDRFRI
jgi:hypothetical protein